MTTQGSYHIDVKFEADRALASAKGLNSQLSNLNRQSKLLLNGFKNVVRQFAEFEQKMAIVRSISGATEVEFKRMTDAAREMGRTTRFTAGEAADALKFISMTGASAADAVELLPHTLNLASAGALELGKAADLLTNVMTIFRKRMEEAQEVTDVMAHTAASSNTNVQQLAQSLSYVGPVARLTGLTIEQTSAAIGVLGNAGIQGYRSATGLRSAMTSLIKPTAGAKKVFEELGISLRNLDGSQKNLIEIARELVRTGAGAEHIARIFTTRATPAVVALMNAIESGDLESLTKELDNSAGAAQRMAQINEDTLIGSLKILKSQFNDVSITIGQTLSPTLRFVISSFSAIVEKVGNLAAKFPNLFTAATVLGGAMAALATASAGAAVSLGVVGAGLPSVTAGFKVATLAAKAFWAAVTGPIGRVVAAITLLATAVGVGLFMAWKKHNAELITAREKLTGVDKAMYDLYRTAGQTEKATALLNSVLSRQGDTADETTVSLDHLAAALRTLTAAQLELKIIELTEQLEEQNKVINSTFGFMNEAAAATRNAAIAEKERLEGQIAIYEADVKRRDLEAERTLALRELTNLERELAEGIEQGTLSTEQRIAREQEITEWTNRHNTAAKELGQSEAVIKRNLDLTKISLDDSAESTVKLTESTTKLDTAVTTVSGSLTSESDAAEGLGHTLKSATDATMALHAANMMAADAAREAREALAAKKQIAEELLKAERKLSKEIKTQSELYSEGVGEFEDYYSAAQTTTRTLKDTTDATVTTTDATDGLNNTLATTAFTIDAVGDAANRAASEITAIPDEKTVNVNVNHHTNYTSSGRGSYSSDYGGGGGVSNIDWNNPMAWFDHDAIDAMRAGGEHSMPGHVQDTLKDAQRWVDEGAKQGDFSRSITEYVTGNPVDPETGHAYAQAHTGGEITKSGIIDVEKGEVVNTSQQMDELIQLVRDLAKRPIQLSLQIGDQILRDLIFQNQQVNTDIGRNDRREVWT